MAIERKSALPEHARPKPAVKATPLEVHHAAPPLLALIHRLGNRRAMLHLKRLAGRGDAVAPGLPISQASDSLEREADGVADRLVSGAVPVSTEVPPPAAGQRMLDGGTPLAPESRAFFEPRLGVNLGEVRVHDDPDGHRTAGSLHAAAFTVGHDIVFARGRYDPGHAEGQRLLAHELAHVAQAWPGLILRYGTDEGREDSPRIAPSDPVPAEDTIAPDRRTFTPRVDDREPDLIIVPDNATRADMAARLLGDETLAGEIDVVLSAVAGDREVAVRVREPAHLVAEVRTLLTGALDRQLTADITWTIARLCESSLNDEEQWAVTERTLRWSQRSTLISPSGDSYFDAFLAGLARVTLTQPHWYTLTLTSESHTGLDWLIAETGDKAEQIHKMIALRSHRFTTTYVVRDRSPQLAPGDIAGRFYWSSGSGTGSGLQLRVAQTLVNESSAERAETALRSTMWQGIRIVVPSADGRFYGYAVVTPSIDLLIQGPDEGAEGHYYWYQPGTIMIGAGEFRADFPVGGPAQQAQRRSILTNAMADAQAGEPMAVMGLDFDALSTANLNERVDLTALALAALLRQDETRTGRMSAMLGSGSSPHLNLLMRVILSTPNSEFPAYERTLSSRGLLTQLLSMWDRPELALVGRAFTAKTLASIPIGVEVFAGMETLQVGQDDDGVYHFGYGDSEGTASQTVARADWPATAAPRIGHEPGMPGEAAGPISRNAIVFHLGTSSRTSPGIHFTTTTRAFLPTELVRVNVVGEHPQSVIVSALEAASILGNAAMSTAFRRFGQAFTINMAGLSAGGLVRAFGPALARALAAESIGEGLGIMAAAAGTTAGRQALMGALLIGSMIVVDAYREELNQSEAGRAFLAVYDLGMAILIAHDIYRLMSSGLLESMASAGRAALLAVTGAARNGVADLTQLFEALKLTAQRALSEGALVEAIGPDGARTLMPANELRVSQLFMMSRAEVAGRAVMTSLTSAGASTTTAQRILQQLETLASEGEELGQAWSAVARKASSLAAGDIESYLLAVERVLGTRRGAAADLANFLRASARAADPVAYLGQVELLASRGISPNALRVLGNKALAGRLDLEWLNSLGMSDADLSFLAADSRTPWEGIRRAVSGDSEGFRTMMRARIRGAAAEMATEQSIVEVLPGYRISGKQVTLPSGTIIDFELMATDGTGRTIGLEVKGYRGDTWRDALNAWAANEAGATLNEEQQRLVRMLEDDIAQFQAGQGRFPGDQLHIGVTRDLTGPTLTKLRTFLARNVPGATLVFIEEDSIAAVARRFRLAFGLEAPPPP